MVDSDGFDVSCDAAFVALAFDIADGMVDANTTMLAGAQLKGAVRFIRKFKILAEVPQAPADDPITGLIPTDRPKRA
jgi:hypothetical protein